MATASRPRRQSKTTVRLHNSTPESRAAHQALAARLVPHAYIVVGGTETCPKGTIVVEIEDPERMAGRRG